MENLETNLIPVIIQHSENKDVLMLGYMNNEALKKQSRVNMYGFIVDQKKGYGKKGKAVAII